MKPFCSTLLISFPSARPHTSACAPDLFIAIKILIATTEGRSSNVSSWRRRASTCTQKGRYCARRDRQCMLASRPAPRRCNHHAIAERHTQPGRSHLLSEVGVGVVVVLLQSCLCRSLHILNGTFVTCKPSSFRNYLATLSSRPSPVSGVCS